jgi:transcriptional regulator with XRE-family HTH domain
MVGLQMPNSMDRHLVEIAARVHRWRVEADYTLQELAQRSGVAASTVHKIEKNQTVPTISVLLKICAALSRRPDELLSQDSQDVAVKLQHREDRLVIGSEESSLIEQLASGIANPTLDIWRVYHQPGTGSGPTERMLSYEGELIVLCEEGELTFTVEESDYRVEAGDSIHIKTVVPHCWTNTGDTLSRALFFGTIPKGLKMGFIERAQKLERDAQTRGVLPSAEPAEFEPRIDS